MAAQFSDRPTTPRNDTPKYVIKYRVFVYNLERSAQCTIIELMFTDAIGLREAHDMLSSQLTAMLASHCSWQSLLLSMTLQKPD